MMNAQLEGTDSRYARQGRHFAWHLALFCTSVGAPAVDAQQLPYTVTIVDWQQEALQRQRRLYRAIPPGHEALFCVERWAVGDIQDGYQRILVTRTRKEETGNRHHIDQAMQKCLGEDGTPLPMIHTHSEGNCQPSPNDLVLTVARGAPFDGIQCGEHHVAWFFAWQIQAISNTMYASKRPP
jgi:hypothetical protein